MTNIAPFLMMRISLFIPVMVGSLMTVTNFHLPESTLIMLAPHLPVKVIMNAYQQAIDEKYRFLVMAD